MGVMRAEVKQGIRMVIGCKGADGKVGLRVQHINKGVFVSFVQRDSPAAMAGKHICQYEKGLCLTHLKLMMSSYRNWLIDLRSILINWFLMKSGFCL